MAKNNNGVVVSGKINAQEELKLQGEFQKKGAVTEDIAVGIGAGTHVPYSNPDTNATANQERLDEELSRDTTTSTNSIIDTDSLNAETQHKEGLFIPKATQQGSRCSLKFVFVGEKDKLFNLLPSNTYFHLTSYTESSAEISQVSKNFLGFKLYTFGTNPSVETFQGVLRNTANYQWKNMFDVYYDNFLKSSKCAQFGAQALIEYDDTMKRGALLNISKNGSSNNPYMMPVSFQMIVFKEYNQYKVDALNRLNDFFSNFFAKGQGVKEKNSEFAARVTALQSSLEDAINNVTLQQKIVDITTFA